MPLPVPTTRFGRCPIALLRHLPETGEPHLDFFIALPTLYPRLWSARVGQHWRRWPGLAEGFELVELAPHRRRYLQYSGPLSDGRGSVLHLAHGWADLREQRPGRMTLRMHVPGGGFLLRLDRVAGNNWCGTTA